MNKRGWIDDFLAVVLIMPCLLAFMPGLQDVVSRGFQIIGQDAPGWYLAAVGAAVGWAFGKPVVTGAAGHLRR